MDADAPTTVVIPVTCAPQKAPCPHCGKRARRVRTDRRQVRTSAYKRVACLRITYGEYQARCGCCRTFRTCPDGVRPRCPYDTKVRPAVLDRIRDDGRNVAATRRSLRRDFLLELSTGFVYACRHTAAADLDLAAHRLRLWQAFAGTLCLDELHRGQYTWLLATDPLADLPVAFALVSQNDKGHRYRFRQNRKSWGLWPRLVVTDGSSLYPDLLAQRWPHAEHPLCVVHLLQDLNAKVLDAVKRRRRQKARQGNAGRQRRPGRPRQGAKQRRGPTAKDKAPFVFKRRHRIVKRRDRLTASARQDLASLLEYVPGLRPLRQFADALQRLFAREQTEHQAWCRWRALQRSATFLAVPELQEALAWLTAEKFGKAVAFLRSPAAQRVRTNNQVERCNRKLRYGEKVRYQWRRRTLVRFVVRALDPWWQTALPPEAAVPVVEAGTPRPDSPAIRPRAAPKPKKRKAA